MSKQDVIIILAVLILGGVLWLGFQSPWQRQEAGLAVVTIDEATVAERPLTSGSPPEQFTLQGKAGPLTIETDGDKIRIVTSTCPDQTCVKTGWAQKQGQTIVCVPNHLVIRVQSGGNSGLDAITY